MTLEGEVLSGEDVTIDYIVGEGEEKAKSEEKGKGKKQKAKQKKAGELGEKSVETDAQPEAVNETKKKGDDEGAKYEAQVDPRTGLLVLLDIRADAELEEERLARELINRIQRTRKKVSVVFCIDNRNC